MLDVLSGSVSSAVVRVSVVRASDNHSQGCQARRDKGDPGIHVPRRGERGTEPAQRSTEPRAGLEGEGPADRRAAARPSP